LSCVGNVEKIVLYRFRPVTQKQATHYAAK
jgi:hypothetical protein